MSRILFLLFVVLTLTACSFKCAVSSSIDDDKKPRINVSCTYLEKERPPVYRNNSTDI